VRDPVLGMGGRGRNGGEGGWDTRSVWTAAMFPPRAHKTSRGGERRGREREKERNGKRGRK